MKHVVAGFLTSIALVGVAAAQNRPSLTGESHSRWSTSINGRQISVDSVGAIELTDDERDIKSIAPNGSFEMSSRGWLSLFGQRYIVRSNADGTLTRVQMLGASEHPIDAAARAWIGDTLQHLIREGFAAESRVKRILAQQGPAGVLDAAASISSDYVQAKYFMLLAAHGQLDRATAERALRQAGEDIGSDFELARVLNAMIDAITLDEAMTPVLVQSLRSIGSDFEHSRVLRTLIARRGATTAVVNVVLMSSTTIGSDFEKSRVLRELAERRDLDAPAVLGLIRASGSINSDFEQSRVLRQIAGTQVLDETSRREIVDSARRIGSEYERTRVLAALVQGSPLEKPQD